MKRAASFTTSNAKRVSDHVVIKSDIGSFEPLDDFTKGLIVTYLVLDFDPSAIRALCLTSKQFKYFCDNHAFKIGPFEGRGLADLVKLTRNRDFVWYMEIKDLTDQHIKDTEIPDDLLSSVSPEDRDLAQSIWEQMNLSMKRRICQIWKVCPDLAKAPEFSLEEMIAILKGIYVMELPHRVKYPYSYATLDEVEDKEEACEWWKVLIKQDFGNEIYQHRQREEYIKSLAN